MANTIEKEVVGNSVGNNVEKLLTSIGKLLKMRQFRYVESQDKDGKTYKKYRITGAKTMWKKDPAFVYSYETRLCGPHNLVSKFIATFSKENIGALTKEYDALGPGPTPYPKSISDMESNFISMKNYAGPQPNVAYSFEILAYQRMNKDAEEVLKQAPSITEVYTAFLKYKSTKTVTVAKSSSQGGGKRGGTLRMENLGELYNNMGEGEIMNAFGYSEPKGKAKIIKVEDTDNEEYDMDGKTMYKVPNYRIITSRRNDAEYALRDLSRQNAIELSTHKIKEVMDEWTSKKRRLIQAAKAANKSNGKLSSKSRKKKIVEDESNDEE